MDLFTVPTIAFGALYCFFVISHDRRHILHVNVTKHPTSGWIIQQLREAFPFSSTPKFLIFDRAAKYGRELPAAVRSMEMSPVRTSFESLCLPKIPFSGSNQCNIVTLGSKLATISIVRDTFVQELLDSADTRLRYFAANKLAQMNDESAVDPLLLVLNDSNLDPWMRVTAAWDLEMLHAT